MEKMTAYCGLVCTSCPTFLATKTDDNAARAKTAELLAEKYGLAFKPEEINCEGCLSNNGVLIGYCQTCEIRKCCRERGVDHCAFCGEQPCDKLSKFHELSPEAKIAFESLLREMD